MKYEFDVDGIDLRMDGKIIGRIEKKHDALFLNIGQPRLDDLVVAANREQVMREVLEPLVDFLLNKDSLEGSPDWNTANDWTDGVGPLICRAAAALKEE